MRKCFVSDNSSHWYCILVELKNTFFFLIEEHEKLYKQIINLHDERFSQVSDKIDENEDMFESLFGGSRLNMHISNYSFENLEEI